MEQHRLPMCSFPQQVKSETTLGLTLRGFDIRHIKHDAIKVAPGGALEARIAAAPVSQPVEVSRSSLYNIPSYAINNQGSQPVLAAFNWWGAASGPTANDNPGGTGSALSGQVLYRPYLTGPNGTFVFLPLVVGNP